MYSRNRYDKGYERGRAQSPERVTSVSARYTTTPRLSSIPVPRRVEQGPAPKYSSYRPTTATGSPDLTKYSPRAHATTATAIATPTPHKPKRSPDRLHAARPSASKSRSPDPSLARDKDATVKSDKTGFNSYSSYKLYPRTSSYTRPITRSEPKADLNLSRYGIGNRYNNTYYRTNGIDRTNSANPNQFDENSNLKYENVHQTSNVCIPSQPNAADQNENGSEQSQMEEFHQQMCREPKVTMVTRHTSPTPPGSSVYVRQRRADMAKTIEESVTRSPTRPEMCDKGVQSERVAQRIATMPTWSPYADTKFSPPASGTSYTGYAGRYSTYSGGRDQGGSSGSDRSNVQEGENLKKGPRDNSTNDSSSDKEKCEIVSANVRRVKEIKPDCVTVHRMENHPSATQPEDASEIIINVSFKLNNSKTPIVSITPEKQITSEITINQLPPQAPKSESNQKPKKKIKVRKSSQGSTDSTNSSGKKSVRKRSTSSSSVESETASLDGSSTKETSEPRIFDTSPTDSKTNGNINVGKRKNKHSTPPKNSRESNSSESSIATTTPTSSSEDEFASKSKYATTTTSKKKGSSSRTSADEGSMSFDHSIKQATNSRSPKNEPRTEEAKSFLIRALGPVSGFFKPRLQDSDDKSHWLDSPSESTSKDIPNISTESEGRGAKNGLHEPTGNLTTEKCDNSNFHSNAHNASSDRSKPRVIRHVESGERAWWLQSDNDTENKISNPVDSEQSEPQPPVIRHIESGERAWWLDSYNADSKNESNKVDNSNIRNESPDTSKSNCKSKLNSNRNSDDKPWWLDSAAEVPEGVERISPSEIAVSNDKYDFFRIRHIDSGEKEWWQDGDAISSKNCSQSSGPRKSGSQQTVSSDTRANLASKPICIRHVESGERAWWMSDSSGGLRDAVSRCKAPRAAGRGTDKSTSSDDDGECEEVAALEVAVHVPPFPSWGEHGSPLGERVAPDGGETEPRVPSPYENVYVSRYTDIDDVLGPNALRVLPADGDCEEVDAARVLIHDSTPQRPVIKKLMRRSDIIDCTNEDALDDAALQVFKDGDFGAYLDLDSTVAEQLEELEGVQDNRKNAIVLRTQLPVRVHAIIERLLNSSGRELRYTLFSLKGALGADKDLAHAFVAGRGLDALMQLAAASDSNFLNYILRALGQLVLYVDGMHGVMRHDACIRWLYGVATGRYRPAASTALKLLLVFVEYAEGNGALVTRAAAERDAADGNRPWHGALQLLREVDGTDTNLALYAMTLINKCLNSLPEQDAYYDQTDSLEEQGIRDIIRQYTARQGADLDLLQQYQIYETVLSHEDGDVSSGALKQLDETIFNAISNRNLTLSKNSDRRKSRRQHLNNNNNKELSEGREEKLTNGIRNLNLNISSNGHSDCKSEEPVIIRNTSADAVRRRRERFTRQASHIQQQELIANATRGQIYTAGLQHRIQNGTLGHTLNLMDAITVRAQKIETDMNSTEPIETADLDILGKRENTVKDLTEMLRNQTHQEEKVSSPRVQDLTGLISKAKEGLAKSQSKDIIRSPTIELIPKVDIKLESDLHWEELRNSLDRKLLLCDMDFTDLQADEEEDVTWMANQSGAPPPPPPPPFKHKGVPPPPPASGPLPRPSQANSYTNGCDANMAQSDTNDNNTHTFHKAKKTVKLFWNEIKELPVPEGTIKKSGGFIWEDLPRVDIDTALLGHLFESRTNDHLLKKLQESKKTMILDTKRSNAINIGMKKLPTPRTIKTAILKMDNTVIGREGVEKLLTMLPTDEERSKIQEAQFANPDVPLGSAEQFLLILASITELESRLKLWAFKLDFENTEREIAEPLMDLKQGIELLKVNRTFKIILSSLLSFGTFLNGQNARGFRLEYLAKVTEVKDTVQKHPLLHHICKLVLDKFPDTGDFFSEVGPVIRASKVDFEELGNNLARLEAECKASWNHLNLVAKHDAPAISRKKLSEFLTDAAQRIIILGIIRKRVMNRFNKFLLYLGVPLSEIPKTKASEFIKIIAEFALEYRTSRDRVLQQMEKKENHRERNKTRGKMIMDVSSYASSSGSLVGGGKEEAADAALKQILLQGEPDRRRKPSASRASAPPTNGVMTGDDEMLESLVRSATSQRQATPRDRKRARLIDRKSLRRTLDGTNSYN